QRERPWRDARSARRDLHRFNRATGPGFGGDDGPSAPARAHPARCIAAGSTRDRDERPAGLAATRRLGIAVGERFEAPVLHSAAVVERRDLPPPPPGLVRAVVPEVGANAAT